MKALVYDRAAVRFAAARLAGEVSPGRGARVGPLRLRDIDPVELPGPEWRRVSPLLSGICGSDLATIDGHTSRYFESIVSFPFVLGHEVVGELADGGPDDGARVVVQPVLSCATRGVDPPCEACAAGHVGGCRMVAFGHLKPGLQTGFCADTGGGWSTGLVAHPSQLHVVPDDLSDEEAVMVEPTACGVHAALSAGDLDGRVVAVLGAGTLGLVTLAALSRHWSPGRVVISAKHPEQRRLATDLGAHDVVEPGAMARAVRRHTRSMATASGLSGGADVVFDCVGSAESIEQALAVVRPRGRVVMVGMPPGGARIDLTPLWHREVELAGAYAYGSEVPADGDEPVSTFELAFELVRRAGLGRLVSARYPLDRFAEAVAHASSAGRRGAVKIVFDLRHEYRRPAWRNQ
ncbi:MAG TPA: zinc-binding dehydrogenase [Acidimicrobiales bacterium]|nr:zinc-binding dehydrogenase [Acidimicrobiales bacterium]